MLTDENYVKNVNFTPSNMVIVTRFNNSINLKATFELLTVLPFDYKINTKPNNRDKVPYFGVERAIVGIRYKGQNRGIRTGFNSMPNIIALDFQYSEKNIHIKISENTLVIVGVLNEEMGKEASKIILSHIIMVNSLFSLYTEIENVEKKIKTLFELIIDNDKLFMFDSEEFRNRLLCVKDPKIYDFFKYLSMFSYEWNTPKLFKTQIKNFLTEKFKCYDLPPKIVQYEIVNGVYHYNLGLSVSLINLTKFLTQKGYPALYNNWDEPNFMYLMIPLFMIEGQNDMKDIKEDQIKTNGKKSIKAHRFRINKSGAIRQTSPSSVSDAEKIKNLVISEICTYLEENFSESKLKNL